MTGCSLLNGQVLRRLNSLPIPTKRSRTQAEEEELGQLVEALLEEGQEEGKEKPMSHFHKREGRGREQFQQ